MKSNRKKRAAEKAALEKQLLAAKCKDLTALSYRLKFMPGGLFNRIEDDFVQEFILDQ